MGTITAITTEFEAIVLQVGCADLLRIDALGTDAATCLSGLLLLAAVTWE